MGKPNYNCMHLSVWVHHMHIDPLFDFLNGRIKQAPDWFLSESKCPSSITGGYVEVTLSFEAYSLLSSHKDWEASAGWMT